MDWIPLLNLIHIVAGVFWAGAAWLIVLFILPAVQAAGDEGKRFMQVLSLETRMTQTMFGSAVLAILSGVGLYSIHSHGFNLQWITTPSGLVLTFGGVFALIALGIGMTRLMPSSRRMFEIASLMMSQGDKPDPELLEEAGMLQTRIATAIRRIAALLFLVIIGMALGRYPF